MLNEKQNGFIGFRISSDLKDDLFKQSEQLDISVSEIIRIVLENYLKKDVPYCTYK